MNQPLLPTIEPSAEDLYQMALAVPLTDKVDKAVKMLRMYNPQVLAYSGGKDSEVCRRLCRLAGLDITAQYSVTTMDPPELIHHIKRQKGVTWKRQPKSMMARMLERPTGPPTASVAWCCEEYKEASTKGVVSVVGVRAEESPRRKGLWKTVVPKQDGGHLLCPICYWTEQDVWEFTTLENIDQCCLYSEGFSRLGCVGCPKAGPCRQRQEFNRWPGFERAWKRAITTHWEIWRTKTKPTGGHYYCAKYDTPEEYWNWWMRQEPAEVGCQASSLFS